MRIIIALLLLFSVQAHANPLALPTPPTGDQIYIASEQLSISISPEDAVLKGKFTFRNSPDLEGAEKRNFPVTLKIPVWIPDTSSNDPSVAAFWNAFQKDALNQVTPVNRAVLDKAVGLDISLGERTLPLTSFYAITKENTNNWVTLTWQQPGYCCLVFLVTESSEFVHDKTPLTLSYRQPHFVEAGKKHFLYMPNFNNLPEDKSTDDFAQYSLKLSTAPTCALDVTHGKRQFILKEGQSVVLSPRHNQAVQVLVQRPGAPEVHSPRDSSR
jgi:hypothetical protein